MNDANNALCPDLAPEADNSDLWWRLALRASQCHNRTVPMKCAFAGFLGFDGARSVTVIIQAFQAWDPGSTPGGRKSNFNRNTNFLGTLLLPKKGVL